MVENEKQWEHTEMVDCPLCDLETETTAPEDPEPCWRCRADNKLME